MYLFVQGPGLFEPIHGSAPDIAGQVEYLFQHIFLSFSVSLLLSNIKGEKNLGAFNVEFYD